MPRSSTAPVLAILLAGCLSPPSGPRGTGAGGSGGTSSGGQVTAAGGSGGVQGSGGTTSTGGTSDSGGSGGSPSGGAGGDSGGSGGTTVTTTRRDAATEQRSGSGGASGGSGGDSTTVGGTTATGGRGGSGGVSSGGAGGAPSGGASGSGGARTGGTSGSGGATRAGGATGSGGATGTGGSTAPTACTFPSAWNPGSATYTTYTLPNAVTACGYNGSNNTIKNIPNGANFAAIPGNTSSDFNTSNRCGACVQIGSAIITIVDECPNDSNAPCKANPSGHLDLSNAGASAGGVKGDPNVRGQNQWKFVPCPVNGNVMVRLKPGNSNEMFIENEIVPIASVTCNGQNGSRTSYGAWHFGQNIPGATCDVTDIANRKITVTAGSTQGQDVDTGKQFPKCL